MTAARRIEYAVLAILGIAAGVMSMAEPPFIGADELYHWHRTVQIAGGDWLSAWLGPNAWGGPIDGGAFELSIAFLKKYARQAPLSWADAVALAERLATQPRTTITMPFSSTASFTPLAYLPQAAAVAAAGYAGLDLLRQSDAGRLANLLCYLGLIGVILRLLPWGRPGVLVVMTLPGMLHVAGTLSADPLNLTLPLLLVALVLQVRTMPGRPGWRLGAIAVMCVAVALLKPTLVVISSVVLLVPAEAFRHPVWGWVFRLGCMAVSAAVAAAWSHAYPFVPGLFWGTGADPAATLAGLAAHPLDGAAVVWRTLASSAWQWWQDADSRFGGHAPPYFINPGPSIADAAMLVAVALAAVADPPAQRDRSAALWLGALALGYGLLVITAFMIGFTPPGAAIVMGVQGRYFLVSFCLATLATAASGRLPSKARLGVVVPVLGGALSLAFLVAAIPLLYAMRG